MGFGRAKKQNYWERFSPSGSNEINNGNWLQEEKDQEMIPTVKTSLHSNGTSPK
jgi:hypothetical protein